MNIERSCEADKLYKGYSQQVQKLIPTQNNKVHVEQQTNVGAVKQDLDVRTKSNKSGDKRV